MKEVNYESYCHRSPHRAHRRCDVRLQEGGHIQDDRFRVRVRCRPRSAGQPGGDRLPT